MVASATHRGEARPPAVLHRIERGSIRAVFTGRHGGVSRPPFDGANLATHVGDDPDDVARNRQLLSVALGLNEEWATVDQVHGAGVKEAGAGELGSGDAILLDAPDNPAAIFVADCLPILLVGESGKSAALVHAGWRGLIGGVIEAALDRLESDGQRCATAFIGPHIETCCYEVGNEIGSQFVARFGDEVTRDDRMLDLAEVARRILERRDGRAPESSHQIDIQLLGPCTHSSELFSYRNDGPETGRQAVIAWIEN